MRRRKTDPARPTSLITCPTTDLLAGSTVQADGENHPTHARGWMPLPLKNSEPLLLGSFLFIAAARLPQLTAGRPKIRLTPGRQAGPRI
jgi:hypothetical protein